MLVYLMLSQKSLKLCSLFIIFPLFIALIGWVSLPYLWVHWSFLLLHVVWYWFLLVYFSVQLLYSSALWFIVNSFLYFFYLFVEVFTVFIQSSPKRGKHSYYHYDKVDNLSGKLIICFIKVLFFFSPLRFHFVVVYFFPLEDILLFLHFAWLSVFDFCALVETTNSPSLEGTLTQLGCLWNVCDCLNWTIN